MRVNDQEVTFNVFNALKYLDENSEECFFVRTIDSLVQKQFQKEQEVFKGELVDLDNGELIVEEKLKLIEEQQAVHRWARNFDPLELTSADFKVNVPSIENHQN